MTAAAKKRKKKEGEVGESVKKIKLARKFLTWKILFIT